jgi:hypothetical protein
MPPIEPSDLEANLSSLRFLYMDDDELLSPDHSSFGGSFYESMSIKSVTDDLNHSTSAATSLTCSPTSENREIIDSPLRSGASSRLNAGLQDHHTPAIKRKSIRKSISHALTSPVRAAKDKIQLSSPVKASKAKSKTSKPWQQQLHLPAGVHQDEAIAVLLAKELKMLDI